jgi:hypothetical protein
MDGVLTVAVGLSGYHLQVREEVRKEVGDEILSRILEDAKEFT